MVCAANKGIDQFKHPKNVLAGLGPHLANLPFSSPESKASGELVGWTASFVHRQLLSTLSKGFTS